MCTRFGIAALLIAALAMPVLADHEDAEDEDGLLTCERVCNFEIFVPAILDCSECRILSGDGGERIAVIDVRTNTCVNVSISSTQFQRQERDCDGNLLETVDVLDNVGFLASFTETVHCPDGGSAMQIKDLGNNSWKIAPHRGGFQITLRSGTDVSADICDDAGCYVATVRVLITAEPVECPGDQPEPPAPPAPPADDCPPGQQQ
jgi:hypothetical protein